MISAEGVERRGSFHSKFLTDGQNPQSCSSGACDMPIYGYRRSAVSSHFKNAVGGRIRVTAEFRSCAKNKNTTKIENKRIGIEEKEMDK